MITSASTPSSLDRPGRSGVAKFFIRLWPKFAPWTLIVLVCIPFVGTTYAITELWQRAVSWGDLGLMFGMYCFTGLGVTMGYHRMLTHRSFEAHPILKFTLLVAGSMALEGPPNIWARTHIKHHAHSDKKDDPHSPIAGFWHAHMGWFVSSDPVEKTYGAWLDRDRMIMFVSRTFPIWAVLTFLIPFWIGGWTGLLWGGLVRVFLCHHTTWSINSVCHTFGDRMFDTPDQSRNLPWWLQWIVWIGFGEPNHNNHHFAQRSARHGLKWWQIDISYYLICLLEFLGLVWNVCVYNMRERKLITRKNRSLWRMIIPATVGSSLI